MQTVISILYNSRGKPGTRRGAWQQLGQPNRPRCSPSASYKLNEARSQAYAAPAGEPAGDQQPQTAPPVTPQRPHHRQQQQQQQQQQSPQRQDPAGPGRRQKLQRQQSWCQLAAAADPPAVRTSPTGKPPFLVVVEGMNDMRAVRRAVPGADVYVLGTSTAANSPAVLQELQAAAGCYPRGLLLLLDPDVAGRQGRRTLDEHLPGCLHAFLPVTLAMASTATKHHEQGNVGVEHASPTAIRAVLAAPRRSDPQRLHFDHDQLLRWGLVAELHARGANVTWRRRLVCDNLGLGECDGKQLLRQLNLYGFTQQEVEQALEWAERSKAAAASQKGAQ